MTARTVLIVLCISCAAYTGFVYSSADTTPHNDPTETVLKGKQLWQEKNCQSCHQLYGLGGYMGPDLTNTARQGPDYIHAFLAHGTGRMPNFHLSETEIAQLSSFLQWIDATGQSKVPDSFVHWTGTYTLKP